MFESFEDFINEASRGAIHKAVKAGDYPVTIVVIETGKVVHQEQVTTPQAVPAAFNVLQKEYPKAKLHVEDKGGQTLFIESAEIEEKYTEDDINMSYGFYGQIEANFDEKKAKKLFDQGVKDLQKKYKLTEKEAIGVLNSKMGRKAADQIYDEQAKTAVEGLETYYGRALHKEMAAVQRSLVYEKYDGNMSDFKYEFQQVFVDVTRNPEKAIKKMAKAGKNAYEVRTSTYMSKEEMEEVGKAMGLELVDYQKHSSVAISVYESTVNEGKIQLKRQYTENHPAITAGKSAKIRNKMLEAIADGKLTQEEFNEILREMSVDSGRWVRRNQKYFNVSEDGISLSKFGKRALRQITVNENMDKFIFESFSEFINANNAEAINEGTRGQVGIIDKKGNIQSVYTHYDSYPEHVLPILKRYYKNANTVKDLIAGGDNSGLDAPQKMDFYNDGGEPMSGNAKDIKGYIKMAKGEAGAEYVYLYDERDKTWYMADVWQQDDLVPAFESFETEETEMVSESFKSSKLRNLMNMTQAGHDSNAYGKEKNLAAALYGLSKIKLDEIEDADLVDLRPSDAYKQLTKNTDYVVFYIVDNEKDNPYADKNSFRYPVLTPGILAVSRGKNFLAVDYKYDVRKGSRKEFNMSYDDDRAIGGNKKYRGYDASGIYNVKRAADLADRAIAFDVTAMGKSARDLIQQRAEAKEGAIAFTSDKDFKKAQMQRYRDILANKASKLPLDKIVEDSINMLTKHIADAMKSGEKTKYNEIKIGEDKRGREIKITDASNIMSSILGDYERYVRYMADSEKEKMDGYSSGYYEREAKTYAKRVSDSAKKIKDMDYAW